MRALTTLLLVTIGLTALPATGMARLPYNRHGWQIGFAYGPARAQLDGGTDPRFEPIRTSWREGPAQSIRLGYMLNPRLKFGYEHQAWLKEQGVVVDAAEPQDKIRVGSQLEALAFTYYFGPPSSGWSGLYVIAGGGYAHNRLTLLEPLPPGASAIGETYETTVKDDEFGWGAFGGIGFEYPITRSFAAGMMVSYNHIAINSSIFERTTFIPLTANLNWSF